MTYKVPVDREHMERVEERVEERCKDKETANLLRIHGRFDLEIAIYGLEGDWDPMIDEIIRINDRFTRSPSWLDEALNSGDGTYKP